MNEFLMKLQNADEETKKLVREVMDAHVDDGLKTLDSQLGKYFLEEVRKVMTSSEFDNKGLAVAVKVINIDHNIYTHIFEVVLINMSDNTSKKLKGVNQILATCEDEEMVKEIAEEISKIVTYNSENAFEAGKIGTDLFKAMVEEEPELIEELLSDLTKTFDGDDALKSALDDAVKRFKKSLKVENKNNNQRKSSVSKSSNLMDFVEFKNSISKNYKN